jgi:dTDP-4-amino-4,6-dideoxygalactose transaminase
MNLNSKIFVTKPTLPPLSEFMGYLQSIWDSGILTNGGPFHEQFESELSKYLGIDHISLFTNGTVALVTALKALKVSGEVITTPYSFVATSHALLWNGLEPVFVDIDRDSFNIDPTKIERAITEKTSAILPVHCYGRPCDTDAIEKIASKYNLKIIYDAAHAFGVKNSFGSILKQGDLSVLSFHATKVLHTFEGGAIISPNLEVKNQINQLKNFGFVDEISVDSLGINGKMSEVNAAMGILQLKYIDQSIRSRKEISEIYCRGLVNIRGISTPNYSGDNEHNYSYYPILIEDNYPLERDELFAIFRECDIYVRRYFYPLISDFGMYSSLPSALNGNLPVAKTIAQKVLCLPIYPDLDLNIINKIIKIIDKYKI